MNSEVFYSHSTPGEVSKVTKRANVLSNAQIIIQRHTTRKTILFFIYHFYHSSYKFILGKNYYYQIRWNSSLIIIFQNKATNLMSSLSYQTSTMVCFYVLPYIQIYTLCLLACFSFYDFLNLLKFTRTQNIHCNKHFVRIVGVSLAINCSYRIVIS